MAGCLTRRPARRALASGDMREGNLTSLPRMSLKSRSWSRL